MMPSSSREQLADLLMSQAGRLRERRAFVGLDGFVDNIAHVVDKRRSPGQFERLTTITRLAERIKGAAGHSTNIELVTQRMKLGGNGPILANALAAFGFNVTYLGALGYPQIHPVFQELALRAQTHSIAEAGYTDALEFDDGKIMLTKNGGLDEITWQAISDRFGSDRFIRHVQEADLVAFVNWTMLPHLDEIWSRLQERLTPAEGTPPPLLFIDLADPEKRTAEDLRRALELAGRFENRYQVALGLNEKEAGQVACALDLPRGTDLGALAQSLRERLGLSHLLIHPVTHALLATRDQVVRQDGPKIAQPVLTTGGGDHFNAGFCLGHQLGLNAAQALLLAVATSGFYVGQGRTPSLPDLAGFLRAW